jgi:hypothetical protein
MGVPVIDWNGDEVLAAVGAACEVGVQRTLEAATAQAKHSHRWVSRTGTLEATIGVVEPAHTDGLRTSGSFGALAPYALDVEIGTSRIGPTAFERVAGSGGWWSIPAPAPAPGVSVRQSFTILPPGAGHDFRTLRRGSTGEGPLKEARPFLRPAAYTEFPLLGLRVAAAYRGEAMP